MAQPFTYSVSCLLYLLNERYVVSLMRHSRKDKDQLISPLMFDLNAYLPHEYRIQNPIVTVITSGREFILFLRFYDNYNLCKPCGKRQMDKTRWYFLHCNAKLMSTSPRKIIFLTTNKLYEIAKFLSYLSHIDTHSSNLL